MWLINKNIRDYYASTELKQSGAPSSLPLIEQLDNK